MRVPILLACVALGACDVVPPPEQQSEAARKAAEHTQLRDAIEQPIERAKSANEPNEKADAERAKALEGAEG